MPLTTILIRTGFCAALVGAASTAVMSVPQASARTLTSIKAGERCSWPYAPSGVFVGNFLGYEESKFLSDDSVRQFTTQRCFATHEDCDNWLYTMQSTYPVGASQGRCRYKS